MFSTVVRGNCCSIHLGSLKRVFTFYVRVKRFLVKKKVYLILKFYANFMHVSVLPDVCLCPIHVSGALEARRGVGPWNLSVNCSEPWCGIGSIPGLSALQHALNQIFSSHFLPFSGLFCSLCPLKHKSFYY